MGSMSEFVHSKARDELPKTKRDFCTSTEVSFPAGYDEDDSMALPLESLAGNLTTLRRPSSTFSWKRRMNYRRPKKISVQALKFLFRLDTTKMIQWLWNCWQEI